MTVGGFVGKYEGTNVGHTLGKMLPVRIKIGATMEEARLVAFSSIVVMIVLLLLLKNGYQLLYWQTPNFNKILRGTMAKKIAYNCFVV